MIKQTDPTKIDAVITLGESNGRHTVTVSTGDSEPVVTTYDTRQAAHSAAQQMSAAFLEQGKTALMI